MYADGGGKRPATKRPLVGVDDVIPRRACTHLCREDVAVRALLLRRGLPGFISIEQDRPETTAFEIEDDTIVAIYVMRNPDELRRLGDQAVH